MPMSEKDMRNLLKPMAQEISEKAVEAALRSLMRDVEEKRV